MLNDWLCSVGVGHTDNSWPYGRIVLVAIADAVAVS